MPSLDLWSMLFVFMLATFVGFQVIQNVSRLLHTPLMSLTNAISAIAVVGSILIAGEQESTLSTMLGADRGLRLDDQHRQRLPDHRPDAEDVPRTASRPRSDRRAPDPSSAYLVATALFILSLRWMNDPEDGAPRRRRRRRRHGARRSSARCSHPRSSTTTGSSSRSSSASSLGVPLSRVPLTAVPQRTALSHAFGGLAAGLVGTAKYVTLAAATAQLTTFRMAAIARRSHPRLPDVHRQPDGGRQAAGE